MTKYIVKNCPAYLRGKECCQGVDDYGTCNKIDDCLIKLVIEDCNENSNDNILQLFEIEECEE